MGHALSCAIQRRREPEMIKTETPQTETIRLTAKEVHVWRIPLLQSHNLIQSFRSVLSQDEVERADRFHFETHTRRFIVARAAMRQILGRYMGIPPHKLEFSYGVKGKPEFSPELNENAITFNLSHSRNFSLLAVARFLRLGIDIEFVNHEVATEEIAERFFSVNEIAMLRALPPSERVEAFFCVWTRKEAYIKALGEGLSVPLDSFDVAFGPNVPPGLLRSGVSSAEVSRWSMYDMATESGYKAALVAEDTEHQLQQLEWRES